MGAATGCPGMATGFRLPLLRPYRRLAPPDRFALCAFRFDAPRRLGMPVGVAAGYHRMATGFRLPLLRSYFASGGSAA